MIKRFFNDIKKYKDYMTCSVKYQLKEEFVNSYLGVIWLVLEPLCFMLIYLFIAEFIFNTTIEYFEIFIFLGISVWNFFSKVITSSVKAVSSNKDIITKIYIPKFILILIIMGKNFIKMMVSFLLVFIFMIIYQVPFSINILFMIPIIICLLLFTFAISLILLHFGVFFEDLVKIINIVLKILFYATGIFYDLLLQIGNNIYSFILINFNPLANIIINLRNCILYNESISWATLSIWFGLGLIITYFGLKMIYSGENTYVKVIK